MSNRKTGSRHPVPAAPISKKEITAGVQVQGSQILLYQSDDGNTRIEVRLEDETVWLSLNQLAELFQRDKSVISKHIRNVFEEGELRAEATVAKFATVQSLSCRTANGRE